MKFTPPAKKTNKKTHQCDLLFQDCGRECDAFDKHTRNADMSFHGISIYFT